MDATDELVRAANRVIGWYDKDEELLEALAEIPAIQERAFDVELDIYAPLRAALIRFQREKQGGA